MNQIDKESDLFRYPFGISVKKGDALLDTPKQFIINIFIEKLIELNPNSYSQNRMHMR